MSGRSVLLGFLPLRPSNRSLAPKLQYGSKFSAIGRLIAWIAPCSSSSVIWPLVWLMTEMIIGELPFLYLVLGSDFRRAGFSDRTIHILRRQSAAPVQPDRYFSSVECRLLSLMASRRRPAPVALHLRRRAGGPVPFRPQPARTRLSPSPWASRPKSIALC